MSDVPFEASPATLHDDVRRLLGQKSLGRSRCISQTTVVHLQDFAHEVSPEFLRIVGIVRFAETFHPGQRSRPKAADIQPETHPAGWRDLTRLKPYSQGSHEESVVGPGKLGAPIDPAVLDKSPATAEEYMIHSFPCTTATGIPK